MRAVRAWGAVLGLALLGRGAAAQSCTANLLGGSGTCSTASIAASLTIGNVVQLSISATSTALTSPGITNYNAGFVADAGPTATLQCNGPCRLQISAATATWTGTTTVLSAPARANKPASDLTWSTSAGGPFTGLTTTPVTVQSLAATAGSSASLFYRTLYAWNVDTPGNYSLTVVFTLASP